MVVFCLRKPCLSNPVRHSILTLLFLSFPCAVPPHPSARPDPHARSSVPSACLLGFAGVSPPSHAPSPPCRTRQRKAASAQSSRSGGEGGSVPWEWKVQQAQVSRARPLPHSRQGPPRCPLLAPGGCCQHVSMRTATARWRECSVLCCLGKVAWGF